MAGDQGRYSPLNSLPETERGLSSSPSKTQDKMPILTDDPFLWLTEEAQAAIEAALSRSITAAEPKTPETKTEPKKRVAFLEPLPTSRPVTPEAAGGAEPKPSLKIRAPKVRTVCCPDCSYECVADAECCDGCEEWLWCVDCDQLRDSEDRFCAPCRYEYNAERRERAWSD
jgi:hypothetical protein